MSDSVSTRARLLQRVPRMALYVLVLGFSLPGATATMAAGPLDFLFKPARAPAVQAYVGPIAPPAAPFGLSQMKPIKTKHISRAVAHPTVALPASSNAADAGTCGEHIAPATDVLLRDRTLRPGDAIMTPVGIRIFEGPISQCHSPSELVPLAEAKNVQAGNRTTLAAIDVPSNKTVPAVEASTQTQGMPKAVAKAKPSPQKPTSRSRLAMALPE